MTIRDNGFTFSKTVHPLEIKTYMMNGYEHVDMTGYLVQIIDWLEEALQEVNEAIREVG